MRDQQERTSEKTIHVIYHCKRHGEVIRRTFLQVTKTTSWRSDTFPYQHHRAEHKFFEDGQDVTSFSGLPFHTCPQSAEIPHTMVAKPVQGRLVETKRCNKKCLNATSDTCDCQCAGANHGQAHEIKVVVE